MAKIWSIVEVPRHLSAGAAGVSGRAGRTAAAGVAVVVLALYVADAATGWTGPAVHSVLRDWFVLALYAGGAAACLVRSARVRPDRLAWRLLGAGIALYALGELVFLVADPSESLVAVPLSAELLQTMFYAAATGTVVLLVAARAPRFPPGAWLDAGAAALALAAVVAAIGLPTVVHALSRPRPVMVGLGFPALDVILVTLTVWVLSLAQWRPHKSWLLMTGAFVLLAVGDSTLALRGAEGVYIRGELTSTTFPLAMVLLGLAAWQPPAPRLSNPMTALRVLALPAGAALAAAGLLAVYVAHPFSRFSAALAVAALVVGFIRAVATASEVRSLYESRRYARGFQDSALGMALVGWDLRWLRVNPALCRMLRYPADQLVGHSVLEVTHENDLLPVDQERERGLVDEERSTFEKRYVRSDGVVLDVEITTSLIEDNEDGPYFYTQVQDISDRRRAERRQALVADLGFRAVDVTNVDEYLAHVMTTLVDALDVTGSALVTRSDRFPGLEIVAGSGLARGAPYPADSMAGWALSQRRAAISNDVAADERFTARSDLSEWGISRKIAVPVRATRSHVLVVVAGPERDPFESDEAHFLEAVANILASVLDREAADGELRRQALVDGLTGLANRTMLDHHLAQSLSTARRHDQVVAVLLLDLDNFKYVNDTLGHPTGDALLREIGGRLRAVTRDEDLLARLGGDEFVVVSTLPTQEVDVHRLAGRLLDAVGAPFAIAGHELHVGASIGIAVTDGRLDAAEMLRDADVAMYRAKARTGSGYEVFDADLRRRIVTRVELESDLRHALRADDQLLLHYQPIVELATGALRGFEALVRWQHPRDGLLAPDLFLPIAEETGLIVPLGERVLDAACARLAHWSRIGADAPYVSVNLSARQLTSTVPESIERCLRAYDVDPGRLIVEVTEHVLLTPEVAVPVLRRLREMGIEVALDDFGTGYSSLSYLETYPLDAIKLDRGFVTRAVNPRSAAILRAAVEMGRALGLAIVAEGIEDEAHRELLQGLGCTIGQGYLFSRPLPAAGADALVERDGALAPISSA